MQSTDTIVSAVLELIRRCEVERILAELQSKPELIKPNYFNGRSMLEVAMTFGCLPLVRTLIIDKGVRLKKDIISLANHNYLYLPIRSKPEVALFIFSIDIGHYEITEFLFHYFIAGLEATEKAQVLEEALASASSCDNEEYVNWLCKVGGDVNCDRHGDTPLIIAASVGANRSVEALVRNGAVVNKIVEGKGGGADALWTAVRNQHLDTVQVLLRHGANPYNTNVRPLKNYPDAPHGNTLDVARAVQNEEIITVLEEALRDGEVLRASTDN